MSQRARVAIIAIAAVGLVLAFNAHLSALPWLIPTVIGTFLVQQGATRLVGDITGTLAIDTHGEGAHGIVQSGAHSQVAFAGATTRVSTTGTASHGLFLENGATRTFDGTSFLDDRVGYKLVSDDGAYHLYTYDDGVLSIHSSSEAGR